MRVCLEPVARIAAALAALSLLQGCVAALVPLAAGAAMAPNLGQENQAPGGAQPTLASAPEARSLAQDGEAEPALPSPKVQLLDLTALPAPSSAQSFEAGANPADPLAKMLTYSLAQAQVDLDEQKRQSAALIEPSSLRIDRQDCADRPPAIAIDLDPGRETFDPLTSATPEQGPELGPELGEGGTQLAGALAQLRAAKVSIFWLSRLGENFAEPLRDTLAQANLDPQGADQLVLMRSLDDRKQTRREALSNSHCLIAILGDTRHDFDELYLYLKHPDAAIGLEPMIGEGWFLLPDLAGPSERSGNAIGQSEQKETHDDAD